MASSYDYFLTESVDEARNRLTGLGAAAGYTAELTPNGGLALSRGNAARTMLLGAMAGKQMHMRFDIQFFSDADRIVARLSRDGAASALKGGVIGANRAANAFEELAASLQAGLTAAGVLAETRPN